MQPSADFAVLQFACQDGKLWPIAVVLLDKQDRLYIRARATEDLATKIPPEDVEVVAFSLDQISADARSGSGKEVLENLEDQLSNTIRITERQKTHTANIQKTLENLYEQHVVHGE
jgi:hypothetical protein